MTRLRWTSVAAIAASGLVLGALAFACGTDDGVGPPACSGVACDGGSVDASLADGGADANVPDARSDADPADASDGSAACPGPAGTLDPTFGDGGIVWLYDTYGATSVSYLADGKILLGGHLAAPQVAVVRLLHDGSLDPSFGNAGIAALTIGTASRLLNALAVQTDGKILAVGTARFGGATPYMIVVRLTSNGVLDTTFGDGGVAVSSFGGNAWGVAALADGHIVVSGQTVDYELLRLNADGSPDNTFGNSGRATADIRGTDDFPGWLTVAPGSRYIVSGASETAPGSGISDFSIVRFSADGGLDTSFAAAGKVVIPVGGASGVGNVAVQPDGRLVAAGSTTLGGGPGDFAIFRLTPSGAADLTFGGEGGLTTDFGGQADSVVGVAVMPDSKIVAVGSSIPPGATPDDRIALARYLPNGALDPTFGTGGKVLTPSLGVGTSTEAHAVGFRGCEAVVVGQWQTPLRPHAVMGIARFNLGR
jgi:uncharacterized delta-60 repeat protein